MSLGTRNNGTQGALWVATQDLPETAGHPFYRKLNGILEGAGFDRRVEQLARPYYHKKIGRPSLAPGVYVRMLFIGYFEGIGSERGIAWRCADSFSLREFLGVSLTDTTPNHSTVSRTRRRLPLEFHQEVFAIVLEQLAKHGLLKGETLGIDGSTMEANAAMRSIVRKDSGASYEEFLTQLAKESGIETPTKEDLIRLDRKRKKNASNKDWENPHDPDAKIAKMKNGSTHMAYKPEHAVDLETSAIVAAEVHPADEGDTRTGPKTLESANEELSTLADTVDGFEPKRAEVVADKGYHKGELLKEAKDSGYRTYISEPARGRRKWTGADGVKTDEKAKEQQATYANRRRIKGKRGKELMKKRGEVVERSFAHVLDTGGMRRAWVRGIDEVRKRYLVTAAGYNLGVVLRALLGRGKPRYLSETGLGALSAVIIIGLNRLIRAMGGKLQLIVVITGEIGGSSDFGGKTSRLAVA